MTLIRLGRKAPAAAPDVGFSVGLPAPESHVAPALLSETAAQRAAAFSVIDRKWLSANTAGMAKKPEPPKAGTWDVYRAAHKPKIVGSVQAADADEAVQKAAQQFKVDAWRLIAVQRR